MRKLGLLSVLLAFTIFAAGGVSWGGEDTYDLGLSTSGGKILQSDSTGDSIAVTAGSDITGTTTNGDAVFGYTAVSAPATLPTIALGSFAINGDGAKLVFGGAYASTTSSLSAFDGATSRDFSVSLTGVSGGAATGVTVIAGGSARSVTIGGTLTALHTAVLGSNPLGNTLTLNALTQAADAGSVNVVADSGDATLSVGTLALTGDTSHSFGVNLTASAGKTAKFIHDGDLTLGGAKTTITFTGTGAAGGAAVFQVNGNLDLGSLGGAANGATVIAPTSPAAGVARQVFRTTGNFKANVTADDSALVEVAADGDGTITGAAGAVLTAQGDLSAKTWTFGGGAIASVAPGSSTGMTITSPTAGMNITAHGATLAAGDTLPADHVNTGTVTLAGGVLLNSATGSAAHNINAGSVVVSAGQNEIATVASGAAWNVNSDVAVGDCEVK